ncbi:tetratricopeptide repeat protein [Deinococcus sp. YIM 134068]|uniref:tetratricopeptide repeat protein n=1 Tax=Deinococcus lichenicola TaxID=3118910 RepID=UPI002F95D705
MSPASARPRPAVLVTAGEWDASFAALRAAGRMDEALRTLGRATGEAQDAGRFGALLDLFLTLPPDVRDGPEGVRLHLRLLGNARGAPEVEALVRAALEGELDAPFLHVSHAWARAQEGDFAGALTAADRALAGEADLTGHEAGLAWRTRGRAQAHLGREGWRAAFARAGRFVEGRALGLLRLEEGALLGRQGDQGGALGAYAEALPLFRHDPHHRGWTLHNMGLACLAAGAFADAEDYFTRLAAIRHGADATRARAWCGQAAARRALGEWSRAEALYRRAADEAERRADSDDLRQARRGLGHTLRLAGRPHAALEPLVGAARTTPGDRETGTSWVYADLAATYAALGQAEQARAALARTGPLDGEDADRARLVRAELARQGGDRGTALAGLEGLDPGTLWAREEAHAFPALFGLLSGAGRPVPAPLPRPTGTVVTVRAVGQPRVEVNGRRVDPGTLALVVLCALLDADGELLTDLLAEALEDHTPRPPRLARQRVSAAVRSLRDALGWPGSVENAPGGYRLDPGTEWRYDVRGALRAGWPVEAFLSGLPLPWVTAREQELRQRDANPLSDDLGSWEE